MTELSLFFNAGPTMILRYSVFTFIALTLHTPSGFLMCLGHLGMQEGGLGGNKDALSLPNLGNLFTRPKTK